MVIRYNRRGPVFRKYLIYSYNFGMESTEHSSWTFSFAKSVEVLKIATFKHIKRK